MIRRSEIARGVLTRFFPAAVAGSAIVALILSTIGRFAPFASQLVIGVTGTALLSAFGASAALLAVRPLLRVDAEVSGRKSAVAGALSAALSLTLIGAMSTLNVILALPFIGGRLDLLAMPAGQVVPFMAIPVLSGAALVVATYLPWLSLAKSATAPVIASRDGALHSGDPFDPTTAPRQVSDSLPNGKL
jgi:hypothetical protein